MSRISARVAALTVLLASATVPPAGAQETSAEIRGRVVDPAGAPVAGATVIVTHTASGTRTTVTNDANGYFGVSGLRLGGPYTVAAEKNGFQSGEVKDLYTELSRPQNVTLLLGSADIVESVVVTSSRVQDTTIGVGSQFTAEDVASLPSISRDVKDVIRVDPKIWIDPTNVDAIEIAGTNNRFNTLMVDGIRQGDDFGLNNNGYPTQRSPVSLEWVESVSVQTAAFDAEDSFFQGGEIKIVTKSGTNDFDGTMYYYNFDDSLVGDRSKDRPLAFTFEEKTWGAALGGPIIRDKLFFFVGYETLERTSPVEIGPTGSGLPVPVTGVTQAEYDQVRSIAQSVYNFDPGQLSSELPEDDEKWMAKLDWNIVDGHRAQFVYQKSEGSEIVQNNSSASLRRVATPSNWYERAFPLEQYSVKLYDRWSDTLSTEFKFGRKESTGKQDALRGTDFAEMQITTPSGGTIYLGPDENRHANALTNDLNQAEAKLEWRLGDHTLKTGIEYEELEIFNLFVARSQGQYFFTNIANFQNRTASRVVYQNAVTNDADDGAANFSYDITSLYVQDRWQISPTFLLSGGLRYDSYGGSDKPPLNNTFQTRYGFANTETLDGLELISPRLGFNWQAYDRTVVRGGVGLFGGGTPNVWVSNSFSNDGVTIVNTDSNSNPALASALTNVNGYTLPAVLNNAISAQAGLGSGSVNAIDPDFEVPATWKFNIGFDQELSLGLLGDDFKFRVDLTRSFTDQAPLWKNIRYVQTGTAPDGRPIYSRRALTPSGDDLLLTNTRAGESTVFDFSVEKSWNTDWGMFDFYFGYAHQDVTDVNPATSSTALSNWDNVAVSDMNNPGESTSNYEIKHRFPLVLSWRKAFFGDFETNVGLFAERRSGRAFSYTFGSGTTAFGDPRQASRQRQLLYVPLDVNDYQVEGGLTKDQVENFIASHGLGAYRGQIAPRNAFNSPWVTTVDMKLTQELPMFMKDTRAVLSLEIENLANLLNNDWGQLSQNSFPYVAPVLDARIDAATNQYVFRPLTGATAPRDAFYTLSALPSVWRMQVGIRVDF
jgi:hypothetical protein